MTARTSTMIDAISARWAGAPFKADQLIDQPRAIEQPNATRREQRQRVTVYRAAVALRMPVGDPFLREGLGYPTRGVTIAGDRTAAVLSAEIRDLGNNSAGI